jgi:hypothetical protein
MRQVVPHLGAAIHRLLAAIWIHAATLLPATRTPFPGAFHTSHTAVSLSPGGTRAGNVQCYPVHAGKLLNFQELWEILELSR